MSVFRLCKRRAPLRAPLSEFQLSRTSIGKPRWYVKNDPIPLHSCGGPMIHPSGFSCHRRLVIKAHSLGDNEHAGSTGTRTRSGKPVRGTGVTWRSAVRTAFLCLLSEGRRSGGIHGSGAHPLCPGRGSVSLRCGHGRPVLGPPRCASGWDVLTAELDQPGATPSQAAHDRTAAIARGGRCATGQGRAGAAQRSWGHRAECSCATRSRP
jgi:hypothetical protein